MIKAIWKDHTVAESDRYQVVEGNVYFPPDSVKWEYLKPTDKHTTCPWKGEASYYDITVNGDTNKDAVWSYPEPKEAAMNIKGHVAFGGEVIVDKS